MITSICYFVILSVCIFLSVSLFTAVFLSVSLSICLSVCLSICRTAGLAVCLSNRSCQSKGSIHTLHFPSLLQLPMPFLASLELRCHPHLGMVDGFGSTSGPVQPTRSRRPLPRAPEGQVRSASEWHGH